MKLCCMVFVAHLPFWGILSQKMASLRQWLSASEQARSAQFLLVAAWHILLSKGLTWGRTESSSFYVYHETVLRGSLRKLSLSERNYGRGSALQNKLVRHNFCLGVLLISYRLLFQSGNDQKSSILCVSSNSVLSIAKCILLVESYMLRRESASNDGRSNDGCCW